MDKPTKFQLAVWKSCSKIPKGKVSTYAEIARAISRPKAMRAVGNALNKNPYSPRVPCHRVVMGNGKIGGFADGANRKIKMLRAEGVQIKNKKIIGFENAFIILRRP